MIVPLGFVSDHMEVKWDLDNEATESAQENGLYSVRVPTRACTPRTSTASSTSCWSAATA
ncbi:Ferrochelatase [Clavibacter michiganensis subsp. michiganensis]|uniref:Ferrochelatase n=1 Tax=Clavibacter michiganensis subsp. michiganensis TaxID=33013 RepID=A0A251XGH5_CLAMM|nr:Ferrochelatase [Clavibacter michiganensis subsp. michiganensis]OUE01003.1 Ferrochelatase [Clavibacter michiganensis subsp. michiganensis]